MTSEALAPDLSATAQSEQHARDAARYRWMRVAYVDFDDDDNCNEALLPLSLCYTPEEVDAAIDAELARAAG